jgi:hypothetical protein
MKTFILLALFSLSLHAQEEQLLVGISGKDLQPKIGIPLAGYGSTDRRLKNFFDWRFRYSEASLFKPSEGYHSPIRSKVMILKKGQQNLVFISLDMIGTEARFIRDLAKNLEIYGIDEEDIIVSATHTHGGPGTLSKRLPLMAIAVDFYRKKNYQDILSKVTNSVEMAIANMRPAVLVKTKAVINGVQKNKWRRKNEEHYDKNASFLMAKDAGTNEWLGGLVNFSIHGGTMPEAIMLYSSDVNGAIEKELEQYFAAQNGFSMMPTLLFMNGAEGDVGASVDRSVENVNFIGKKFIEEAIPQLNNERWSNVASEFSSVKKKIYIGQPRVPLNCQGGFLKKLPDWVKPNVSFLLPTYSYISQIKVGDILYLSWPGEASTQLGYNLQAVARQKGAADPIILGLANDYMTYFTTKSEYKEKAYDSCSTIYGWESGDRIIEEHNNLLE